MRKLDIIRSRKQAHRRTRRAMHARREKRRIAGLRYWLSGFAHHKPHTIEMIFRARNISIVDIKKAGFLKLARFAQ